jgi:hypothetical protein
LWQGDIAQIEDLRNQIGSKQRGAGRATIVCLINESGVGGFCAIAPCKDLLFQKLGVSRQITCFQEFLLGRATFDLAFPPLVLNGCISQARRAILSPEKPT